MNPIERILHDYPIMVLDGAMATELERLGCDLHDPLWSAKVLIESPRLIKQVHAEYFAAGADCATTASYQATFEGFERRGYDTCAAAELMLRAVRLATAARDEFWDDPINRIGRPKPLVAASIGSYGAFLADGSEYSGDYGLGEEELMRFHRPRLELLADSEADLLAFETIPSLLEAQALTRLLTEFPRRAAWLTFSARDSIDISHGEPISHCAARLDRYEQIVAIGVNCTAPRYIADLVGAIRNSTAKPIIVYPNSGEIYRPESGGWIGSRNFPDSTEQLQSWYENGARIIGGCCRTTPAQIRILAEWARDRPRSLGYTPVR